MSNTDAKLAQIYRDQWSDYVKRFFPLENELVDTYNNPAVHGRIIGEATHQAASSFGAAQGSYGRTMARFGMSPDAQVAAEADRSFQLGSTLAVVDAKNRTRQALVDRDQGMLAGGMTTGGMVKEGN
jgi:hypothetical protein